MRGVKLADNTLHIVSPRVTLMPGGTMQRTATRPGTSAMVRSLHPLEGLTLFPEGPGERDVQRAAAEQKAREAEAQAVELQRLRTVLE